MRQWGRVGRTGQNISPLQINRLEGASIGSIPFIQSRSTTWLALSIGRTPTACRACAPRTASRSVETGTIWAQTMSPWFDHIWLRDGTDVSRRAMTRDAADLSWGCARFSTPDSRYRQPGEAVARVRNLQGKSLNDSLGPKSLRS